jgi:acyl carrier protein
MTETPLTPQDRQLAAEWLATIRSVITELAPNQDVALAPELLLVEDLGYHSLAMIELAFTLEDEFDLPPIDEEIARGIHTVSDVENYVMKELQGRVAETA